MGKVRRTPEAKAASAKRVTQAARKQTASRIKRMGKESTAANRDRSRNHNMLMADTVGEKLVSKVFRLNPKDRADNRAAARAKASNKGKSRSNAAAQKRSRTKARHT